MGFVGDAIGGVSKFVGGIAGKALGGVTGGIADGVGQIDSVPNYFNAPGLVGNEFTGQYTGLSNQMQGFAGNQNQLQGRDQQLAFAQALQQQAAGGGPSVSAAILQKALQQSTANTNAQAASAKGLINPALLARTAMRTNADAAQGAAQNAMIGRQAEQLNAQSQLGNVLAQNRGQDIQNASIYNQIAQGYDKMGLSAAQDNLASQLKTNEQNSAIAQANLGSRTKIAGGVIQGIGSAGAAAAGGAAAAYKGGKVAGEANASGDHPANDTVKAVLSPGEIVIPRSKAKNSKMAKEFIDSLMKTSKGKSKEPVSFSHVLAAQEKLHSRIAALEKKLKVKVK